MEETLVKYEEGVAEIQALVISLIEAIGKAVVSKDLRDSFSNFNRVYLNYLSSIDKEDLEKIAENSKMVSVYGQHIAQNIKASNLSVELKEKAKALFEVSQAFREYIEKTPLVLYSLSNENINNLNKDVKDLKSLKKQINDISKIHLAYDERIKTQLIESERKVFNLENKLHFIEEGYSNKFSELDDLYKSELANINEKKNQLDVLLGGVSSRVIAQDYETSASSEMKAANWLRYGSLFCMALIIGLVGYSFWHSTQTSFNLESSIFRIVLAFLLSVPAAYLARESTKHREKQYAYLQTSLDLKAISPYLASLPEDMQNQIKVDIANRIFGAKESGFQVTESYPVNTHELIMELIKKLEFNKEK